MGKAYLVNDNYDTNGKEQKINKRFCWNDEKWLIPSVFLSDSSLMINFCRETEPEQICAFMEKWNLLHENESHFTNEEIEQIEAEHPLRFRVTPKVTVNGTELKSSRGSGECWIPMSCLREGMSADADALRWLERYELDPEKGWSFWKSQFCLEESVDEIRSLEIELIPERISIAGPHLADAKVGDYVNFAHPVTGTNHKLLVKDVETQMLTEKHFRDDDFEYPKHFAHMTFSVEPPLERNEFSVWDCAEGDRPRKKHDKKKSCGAMAVAVIGGEKGNQTTGIHSAMSSLYFEPAEHVEWRIVFHVDTKEKMKVELIKSEEDRFEY